MGHRKFLILFTSFFFLHYVSAQQRKARLNRMPGLYLNVGDSIFLFKGICKNSWIMFEQNIEVYPTDIAVKPEQEIPFLKVHGNITYNFSYRSYIDTPFAQSDLMQHLVQTTLNFMVKNKYPVMMTITSRSSNSSYFRNFTDVNVQFNQRQLLNNIKADFISKAGQWVNQLQSRDAEKEFASRTLHLQQMQAWVNNPARIQEIVEEKEKMLRSQTLYTLQQKDTSLIPNFQKNSLDRINIFSNKNHGIGQLKGLNELLKTKGEKKIPKEIEKREVSLNQLLKKDSSYIEKYNKGKRDVDSLKEELKKSEIKLRSLKKGVQDSVNKIKNEINGLTTPDGLYAFMKKKNISKDEITKAQKILLAVNQIGIGKSWIDYSELTVKNVSLAGINAEINPGNFYVAFAAGKVNYRFRDFIYKNSNSHPDQCLYVFRAGLGKKESNNIIATLYNGNKSVLNYTPTNTSTALQKVIGISLEGKFLLDKNNYVIGEFAKSSYLVNPLQQPTTSTLLGKVFNLKTHTNEAYSIKLFSQNPGTNTKLTAYYKQLGENFQSFNLYPINISQNAWMVKLNQSLWKKRLMVDAAIRKNDFTSPIAAPSFSNQMVFKSLQLTLRIPKCPFVSVGYYPTSQLKVGNGNILSESQYNTFNSIVSHSYKLNRIAMSSNMVFTKFYNNSNDTGFIYYNASSFTVSHSVYLLPFSLQTTVGILKQKQINLFTIEQQVNYQINRICSLTAGLKWNKLNHNENLFGSTAGINLYLKGFGTVQMNYDKTYLPGTMRTLVPVDMGRMTFYRQF